MITHIEKAHGSEYIPEDLKDMKQILNAVTKLEDISQSNEDQFADAPSGQSDGTLTTVAQFAGSEISSIENSTNNIPLLIVSENTLKDLLVPQSGVDVQTKLEDQPDLMPQSEIKCEDITPKSEATDDRQEQHTDSDLALQQVPRDKNVQDTSANYRVQNDEEHKHIIQVTEDTKDENIIWSVETTRQQIGDSKVDIGNSNPTALVPVDPDSVGVIQSPEIGELTYQQEALQPEECPVFQRGHDVDGALVAETATKQNDAEGVGSEARPAEEDGYQLQLLETGQEPDTHPDEYAEEQQFVEITEEQLRMSDGRFIVVDESLPGEQQVIMITGNKQLVLEPGQQLLQADGESLIIMSEEQATMVASQGEM